MSAPGLVSSSRFVACFNMVFLIIMSLNTVGLVRLLQLAMRQRILRTTDAAPEGALDRNTEDVSVMDISLEDSGVHKGGFRKGGFSNLCVVIILLLLNHPLLNPPL